MMKSWVIFLLMCKIAFADLSTTAANIIQQIPESDQRDLERFFQLLIRKELMGYTLFGEKPISCVTCLTLENSGGFNITKYLILEKGWQAWLRNKHLVPDKYFSFKRKSNGKILSIYLINKKMTLEMIRKNQSKQLSPKGESFIVCLKQRYAGGLHRQLVSL